MHWIWVLLSSLSSNLLLHLAEPLVWFSYKYPFGVLGESLVKATRSFWIGIIPLLLGVGFALITSLVVALPLLVLYLLGEALRRD